MAIETTMRGLMTELRQEGVRVEIRGVVSQRSAVASRQGIVVRGERTVGRRPLDPSSASIGVHPRSSPSSSSCPISNTTGGCGRQNWKKHGSVSQIAASGQSPGNRGPWRVENEQKATPPEGGTTNEPAGRPRSDSLFLTPCCPRPPTLNALERGSPDDEASQRAG